MIRSRKLLQSAWAFLILLLATLPCLAELPYKEHGWSKHEAAAHLLSRLSYGARPGEVDRVARTGLENWLNRQLNGNLPDSELQTKLDGLPLAYTLDNRTLREKYPPPFRIRRMAEEAGILNENGRPDREAVADMLREKGMRPYRELGTTLFAQRLYHARYSENSLREVLTDFWFNHFNVAISNNRARDFVLSYERDAIRPNVLGNFRTLLGATAKHPAMLWYLDNARSTAGKGAMSTMESRMDQMSPKQRDKMEKRLTKRKKGLNENYARELMELHTLGVDGGYSQKDVVEVARAFTGWTSQGPKAKRANDRQKMMGVVTEGDFRFAAALHDAGSKTVLGQRFPADGGVEEGERVLDILASHSSTARHIATKLATRFISDHPNQKDVEQIARAFRTTNGDIPSTMRALVRTDGFWDKKNRQAKVKTPFELVVSANRALGGDLYPSRQLYGWLAKMGQPLYNYQAPTGFPDNADHWVSSATVLNRVNFALMAARGMVPGFSYQPHAQMATKQAVEALLPYNGGASTVSSVEQLLEDSKDLELERATKFETRPNLGGFVPGQPMKRIKLKPEETRTATLVGLILGTPEFQRR